LTRDVWASASVGGRVNIQGILSWGVDWHIPFNTGTYGLGVEASLAIGLWPAVSVVENSSNTRDEVDTLTGELSVGPYLEAQGSVWIGKMEHVLNDDDVSDSESHKLVGGVRGQIVFQGNATVGAKYICKDYDWWNDKLNEAMSHESQVGNTSINGKLFTRAEIKLWSWTIQAGYEIWAGGAHKRWMGEEGEQPKIEEP
jgi:hypothetical protein